MTNHEVVEHLLAIKKCGAHTDKDRQALNLAIKAIKFVEENYPKTFDDYLFDCRCEERRRRRMKEGDEE